VATVPGATLRAQADDDAVRVADAPVGHVAIHYRDA
jgi:hypothetical protein